MRTAQERAGWDTAHSAMIPVNTTGLIALRSGFRGEEGRPMRVLDTPGSSRTACTIQRRTRYWSYGGGSLGQLAFEVGT